ncbi:MAG: 5-(carboxyamino)imidazole ribonucleotide synthase [Xanthobacteraceae bacterium]
MSKQLAALKPSAVIGILGGGQLGRMLALAAAELGLKSHIYAPESDSCAFDVAHAKTCAAYENEAALARFAAVVDVITYEFENVPAATADVLERHKPVLPNHGALAVVQDRLPEKEFVAKLGIATAPFAKVDAAAELKTAIETIGPPAVLKTRRLGYDGKGQAMIKKAGDAYEAWNAIGEAPAILEKFVPFEREISVVAARGMNGDVVAYEAIENLHRDHILHRSRVPAQIPGALAGQAIVIAAKIAEALNYVGVLAVEMFVLDEGGQRRLLVNEIAPRVHNSGHWTIDGATASQFEQHIRAVAGWPLARPRRLGRIEMINLVGSEVNEWPKFLAEPGSCLHLYGKGEPRPGRKMGHVTRVMPDAAS